MADPTSLVLLGLAGMFLGWPLGHWLVNRFFPAEPSPRYITIFEELPPGQPQSLSQGASLPPSRMATDRGWAANFRIVEQHDEHQLPGLRCWVCGELLEGGEPHHHG